MRRIVLSLAFILICYGGYSQEEGQVQECFENYKAAILDSDGKEALKWVNAKTLTYYSDILAKSLSADSAEVEEMTVVDKVTVLRIRMALTAEEIKKMNGEKFFLYAIEHGYVGKTSVERVDIGEIEVKGSQATGTLVSRGKASPFSFVFDKENGAWKIDLTSLFPLSNQGVNMMIENGGYEEQEFILRILGSLSEEGQTPGLHLWQPLR